MIYTNEILTLIAIVITTGGAWWHNKKESIKLNVKQSESVDAINSLCKSSVKRLEKLEKSENKRDAMESLLSQRIDEILKRIGDLAIDTKKNGEISSQILTEQARQSEQILNNTRNIEKLEKK